MTELRSVEPAWPYFFGSLESHICLHLRIATWLNIAEHRFISTDEDFNKFLMDDFKHLKPYSPCE